MFNLKTLKWLLIDQFMFNLGTAASVVGIASGVNNLFGGGSSGAGNVAGGAYYDPFAQYRGQYATQLNQLMANPASVTSLPGYQFNLQQGQQALNRQAAQTGQQASGAQQVALQQYGQDYSNNYLNTRLSQLSQLSGATQAPLSVVGQNQLNAQNQQQALGNIMGGLGGLSQSGIFGGPSSPTYNSYAPGYVGGYTPTDTSGSGGNNPYGYTGTDPNMGGGTIGPTY